MKLNVLAIGCAAICMALSFAGDLSAQQFELYGYGGGINISWGER